MSRGGGPREWIAQLVDDPTRVNDEDGILAGIASVSGQKIAVYAQDPSIRQGFVSSKGALRILNLMSEAEKLAVPIVALISSPGIDVQEGLKSGEAYTKVIAKTIALQGKLPQIAAVMGPTMGAPAYSCALSDLVLFNKSRSHLVVTGPTVVEKMLGQKTTLGELGGSDTHARLTGLAHFVDPNPTAQIARLQSLVQYLTMRSRPAESPALPLPPIPDRAERPFDMRPFISAIVDHSEPILEMSPTFGRAMITSFAYLEGMRVGVIANQSKDSTGAIDVDAAKKGARFLRLCDSYNVPLITLIDVPGFMPGVREEQKGLLIHGANLCAAMQTKVPRVSVVVRRCYGAAAFLMLQSRAQGGELVLALPNARIATMGYEAAKHMVYGEASALPEKQAELREAYFQSYESPSIAKSNGLIDEIITPPEVRSRLAKHLRERAN